MPRSPAGFRIGFPVCLFIIFLLALQPVACTRTNRSQSIGQENMPRRDINLVLENHDSELMAIPGVVGVYVGVLEDGKTPCLKVMIVEKTVELEKKIPKFLEGYPVLLDETGVIRPMRDKK
jgi:hypothetical protein